MQDLADRTGYEVGVDAGTSRQDGANFTVEPKSQASGLKIGKRLQREGDEAIRRRPRGSPPAGKGVWEGEWVHAFYLETALNAAAETAESGRNVAVVTAVASPRVIYGQLFSQGVDEIILKHLHLVYFL